MKFIRSHSPSFGLGYPLAALPALTRFFDLDGALAGGLDRLGADIYEDGDHYVVTFEVPGVKKDDLKLEVHDRLLTITAVRKENESEKGSSSTATRTVSLPESVKPEAISAKLEDGILTVTLPKSEERKPRTITID